MHRGSWLFASRDKQHETQADYTSAPRRGGIPLEHYVSVIFLFSLLAARRASLDLFGHVDLDSRALSLIIPISESLSAFVLDLVSSPSFALLSPY